MEEGPEALVEVSDSDRQICEWLHLTDPYHDLYAMHSNKYVIKNY